MDTAAEIFLLLTDDEGGKASRSAQNGWALSAANVADLLMLGRIGLGEEKDPRVQVLDPTPTGRPVLDVSLARIAERDGKRLSSIVQDRKVDPTDEVVSSLSSAGIVSVVPKRMLGLVPEKRPTTDPVPERELRERLRSVIAGATPSATDATLLSILQSLGAAPKVLAEESGDLSTKDLKRRIEAASGEVAVSAALKRAIDGLNAAIMTAVIVPAIASGGS